MDLEIEVVATGLAFPEGPVALADGSVLFCEIARGVVSRLHTDGTVSTVGYTGGGPNGLAVGPNGHLYVCNNGGIRWPQERQTDWLVPLHGMPDDYTGGKIQRLDPQTGEVTLLYDRCGDVLLCGPNDLVFDRHGGFYFTDMGKSRERERDIGGVYYARSDGSEIKEVIPLIMQPNGIGLSPDQNVLYVTETETARLWAFDILEPGVLAKRESPPIHGGRFVYGSSKYKRFDSLALEASGNICVATLITGSIDVISPEGELVRTVSCPDPQTTNICFGGADMKDAWITQSYTGQLLRMKWPEAGLELN